MPQITRPLSIMLSIVKRTRSLVVSTSFCPIVRTRFRLRRPSRVSMLIFSSDAGIHVQWCASRTSCTLYKSETLLNQRSMRQNKITSTSFRFTESSSRWISFLFFSSLRAVCPLSAYTRRQQPYCVVLRNFQGIPVEPEGICRVCSALRLIHGCKWPLGDLEMLQYFSWCTSNYNL